MNVIQLNVIAEECCANIRAGEVIAYRRAGDDAWQDPWGGFFDAEEQASLNDLARGDEVHVRLKGVHGPRVFGAHLAAKF